MRASTFFAAAATLATAVSAAAVPTFAKRYNVTEAWGEWQVTNFTASSHPSNANVDFQIWWNQGYSGPAKCSVNGLTVGGDGVWYDCESDASPFRFSLNQDWNQLSLSQNLYQTGSIVHLNGTAPFDIKWGSSIAGSEATADPFYVPVLSVSSTLPNGTTTAPVFSSRK
ncbi:uncharacterized protein BKCO1_1200093 [Diplodia corticola]|uniref:AA1-like domain-containing protein n=1 Tax=Diplodia corticola TaxID=236234 RepID=A0A1J9S8Y7_9PEZI|nr:uncharacterized protein BKCO1_1200093 [Diplodia corticola]OJD36372.1 hypothetical protein BKCO1_1200093 [Diplodia corticola]